ncbi:hypothetical protein HHJ78_07295 [Mobiluncus mulieris]|uniref:DUF5642 domain-containing protein n=1 Tax=Mobiluncus mulieris TaxID=2052 RepID=A0A7Y0U1R9_9ACTO|nr:hypothetical protein [Mobiluncus mulieris]NMW65336.1 hypothetical protein [Mobiluncus mulieris]
MEKTRILASLATIALTASALSGCASTSSSDAKAQYEAKKSEIPQLVKKFSAPNLGVLLNDTKILKLKPEVQSAEETGSTRLGDMEAAKLLGAAKFDPEACQAKLLDTYKDDTSIPAAFSQAVSQDNKTLVRLQLRAHPGVKEASSVSDFQRVFPKSCPKYTLTVAGASNGSSPAQPLTNEVTNFTADVKDYPLDGATDGLMTKLTAKPAGKVSEKAEAGSLVASESAGYTTVGIFQRIGNLELRVFFDGAHPEQDAANAKADLQRLVTHIGQAFVAKAQ